MKIRRRIQCFTVNVEVTTEDGNTVPDFIVSYFRMPSAREIAKEMEMRHGQADGSHLAVYVKEIIPTSKVMEMAIEKFIENVVEVNE